MICLALMIWVGVELSMPALYYFLIAIAFIYKLISGVIELIYNMKK